MGSGCIYYFVIGRPLGSVTMEHQGGAASGECRGVDNKDRVYAFVWGAFGIMYNIFLCVSFSLGLLGVPGNRAWKSRSSQHLSSVGEVPKPVPKRHVKRPLSSDQVPTPLYNPLRRSFVLFTQKTIPHGILENPCVEMRIGLPRHENLRPISADGRHCTNEAKQLAPILLHHLGHCNGPL